MIGKPSEGRRRLVALPSLLALADVAVTLAGQPQGYWEGDRQLAIDGNPLVQHALTLTPWLALPASVAWILGIVILLGRSSWGWARGIYLTLCMLHLSFVWAWMFKFGSPLGIGFLPVAILVVAIMRTQLVASRRTEASRD